MVAEVEVLVAVVLAVALLTSLSIVVFYIAND